MKLILIAGGSGSGKSTLAEKIVEKLGGPGVATVVHHDSYFLDQSSTPEPNFDKISALDNGEFARDMAALERGEKISVPIYDYKLRRANGAETLAPTEWVIAEGLYPLAIPAVRRLADFRIFIEVDPVVQFARRILRDAGPAGRLPNEPLDEQVRRYLDFVKPEYDRVIGPSARFADLIVRNDGDPATMVETAWENILALRDTFSA